MTANPDRLERAWRMLADLDVSVAELRGDLRARPPMPTIDEYTARIAAAAGPGARRNSRNGRHAGEHVIAAARAVYMRAIADGLIDPGASPAH